MVALVQGESTIAPDLQAMPVYDQELVIVPSGLKRIRLSGTKPIPIIAIEEHTEAWRFTKRGLKEAAEDWNFTLKVQQRLQGFSAIVRMAVGGFGHGLAPRGVAEALGVKPKDLICFPKPGLSIPVCLVGRKSTLARPLVSRFYEELVKIAPR